MVSFAEDIAQELGLDLPQELSMEAYKDFIDSWKNDFYNAFRIRRFGGSWRDFLDYLNEREQIEEFKEIIRDEHN